MARKQPRSAAQELVTQLGAVQPPIDVMRAAALMNVQIVARRLPSETSGMLLRTEGATVIGVNGNHPEVRRRFSIAHELGHLLLHPGRPLLLHEDIRVNFRDQVSSMATNAEEIEANAFAAELLMPAEMVREAVAARGASVSRRDLIHRLAGGFGVSRQAMEIRLVNLGVLLPE